MDAGDTDAEAAVVRELVRLGLPRPQQQVQAVAGPKVYVLDLAWPELKIAIELDGFDPHGILREAFDHDRDRDLRLRRAGWEIIRITTRTDLRLLASYLRPRLARLTISE
jgi:very-short-patch-repair endonuclease